MSDRDQHIDYAELIARYLSGNAAEPEVQQLEAWVLADPENKETFIACKKAWMLSGMKASLRFDMTADQWRETAAQLTDSSKTATPKVRTLRQGWLRIAAAAALILIAGLGIYQLVTPKGPFIVTTANSVNTVITPDRSRITLEPNSSLVYAAEDGLRKLILSGTAFFDVAEDKRRPFIIESESVEIEVLGTTFYVATSEGQARTVVSVLSGQVAVRAAEDEVQLRAGERTVYDKEVQQLTKLPASGPEQDRLYIDDLNFENADLKQVAFALSRVYALEVVLRIDNAESCRLTADYTDQSLPEIIRLLEATWGISIAREGGKLIWAGVSCQ